MTTTKTMWLASVVTAIDVLVAPVCRREFREPFKEFGLTDGQEQENIYEKRQGTHA
jgi:hypothetical protein